jgi:hypothetical protein
MKRIFLPLAALVLCTMFVQAQINVNVNAGLRGDTISEKQYGIFFERSIMPATADSMPKPYATAPSRGNLNQLNFGTPTAAPN